MAERLLRALMLWCALLSPALAAQRDADDDVPKSWVELEVQPPPFPRPANLIEFEASAATTNRFLIDAESISVGADGVIRYVLVVRSPSGAENISFEGIRCQTREQKYYAFGRRDGTWTSSRQSEWRLIRYKDVNRQHHVLFGDYFCYDATRIRSPKEAIQRLKYGAPKRNHPGE